MSDAAYDDCPRCAPKQPATVTAAAAEPPAAPTPPVSLPSRTVSTPEPVRAEPVRAEPVRAEPVRAEPLRAEPPVEAVLPSPPPPAPVRGTSQAVVAVLAFGGIAAVLAVLYLFVLPRGQQAASEPAAAKTEQAALETPAASRHPLAKHLEVTGVRLSSAPGGKLKIQYIVVNHSAAALPDLKMTVALTSAGRQYAEFAAAVPSLGPYEARDLTATATTDAKPYELPDWQMFQPQFRITD
jgi:hypothetical protein